MVYINDCHKLLYVDYIFVIVLDCIAFYQAITHDILCFSKPELVSNFLIQPNISCCLQLVSIYSRMKCDTFPSQPLRKWKKKKRCFLVVKEVCKI